LLPGGHICWWSRFSPIYIYKLPIYTYNIVWNHIIIGDDLIWRTTITETVRLPLWPQKHENKNEETNAFVCGEVDKDVCIMIRSFFDRFYPVSNSDNQKLNISSVFHTDRNHTLESYITEYDHVAEQVRTACESGRKGHQRIIRKFVYPQCHKFIYIAWSQFSHSSIPQPE
jgi:hypothetical protein